ncbi:SGNH/GDSL hydrolase family protein [Flavobacterium laiguense]|uniref:G-D-S-L family lipolytic protein n=1 Tax=Flavobacterium laiguense TaxID=2169409 RepID=A0A2U1K2H8_9FLAO|nr:G-D-S-L family lipolytic protein [Flavobacterium laiguense]PWA11717.1 G-D-S-L family lipolytic protein [Flavobacterium laiguense]
MIKNFKWLLLASLSFVACNNNDDDSAPVEIPITPGSAVLTKYVALGDSFSAGYSDGALFVKGQEGSYVNVLSQQFAAAGGGAFTTPLTSDNVGGLLFGGVSNPDFVPRVAILGFNPDGTPKIAPVPFASTTEVMAHITGPFNNLGIPGAKSYHLIAPGYGSAAGLSLGTANPYFVRFATVPGTTVLKDATDQNPTFFSLWIGGNDVLAYATSGGVGVNQTGNLNPATYGKSDITDPGVFANVYSGLVTKLTEKGAKGVVANLPYVNTLPHFTTVPVNPLTASVLGGGSVAIGNATIKALNAQLYGPLKQALTAFGAGDRISLLSETNANPLLIKDESLPNLSAQLTAAFTPTLGAGTAAFYGLVFGQARQAKSTDLVLLTTKSAIGAAPTDKDSGIGIAPPSPLNKFGITYPLQDKHILIPTEIAEIKTATDAYNITIEATAAAKGLAFVDTRATMAQLSSGGIRFGTFQMTSSFVTGGAFSLDGVHPSARGYALIANLFVDAINTKYTATLRHVDLSVYPIQYPAVIK